MEKKDVVIVDNITKDYGLGRGNFNISFNIKDGEAVGIVGENGAGKTTLMRQFMGFIKPNSGKITIYGLDAYTDAAEVKNYVGYVPGEINYPDVKSGIIFLNSYAKMCGVTDFTYADSLIKRLQLDIRAYPKRMSKGMKQKTAIVTALMKKPPLVLLDEPTTGLDPLMRDELLNIILEEKQKGTTIFMSSNSIEELEKVCDKVILISNGKILDVAELDVIRNIDFRDYKIEFNKKEEYLKFIEGRKDIIRLQDIYNQATVRVKKEDITELLQTLTNYDLRFISQLKYDLAKYFDERRKGGN